MSSLKTANMERDSAPEQRIRDQFDALENEVRKVVVGEDKLIETMLLGFASEGNVVAESPPGEGKSLTTKTFAKALDLSEGRIEFNPQLMPQDVLGYRDPTTGKIQKGKIFNNLILAEEINRASGRVKSAFLGPMQEHAVSLLEAEDSIPLPRPFYVLATMNPVETTRDVYNLTTAELDRFALRVRLKKKTARELEIIATRDPSRALEHVQKVMNAEELWEVISYVKQVSDINETHPVSNYIARLASKMPLVARKKDKESGSSPRAVRSFWLTLNAYRIIRGLDYIGPEHVRYLIRRAWHHRIIARNEERRFKIIDTVLDEIVSPVPRPDDFTEKEDG